MPPDTSFERGKLDKVKDITKTYLRRFGPILITGLAAIAEHHWLNHDNDEPESAERRDDPDRAEASEDRHSIRKLEREVKELKQSLSRKAREDIPRDALPRRREEAGREWGPAYQEDEVREQSPEDRPQFDSYQYPQYRVVQPIPTPRQEAAHQYMQVRERDDPQPAYRQQVTNRRRRRHRHSSLPNHRAHKDEAKHAGKVAAIAGAIETIHMDDLPGDWIGPKGVRVGTTMAATYAASRSRERGPDDFRPHEVVADVGTGLLVSRLVHGSSRKLGEDDSVERRGRRWSHCY